MNFPENPAGLAAAQAQYLARKENDPAGFMTQRPDWGKHGFDVDNGKVFEAVGQARFGQWEDSDLDGKDADLAILRGIHDRAVGQWRGLPDTLRAVRDDDDPTLNTDGRLKVAARILEPKLKALEDLRDRELPRIAAEAEREEGEVDKVMRDMDPAAVAAGGEIRTYLRGLNDSKRNLAVLRALQDGDVETLRAIALAPVYLSGVTAEQHQRARETVSAKLAPERVARITALRNGAVLARRAVDEYTRITRSLIDFRKAGALIERENKRNAAR